MNWNDCVERHNTHSVKWSFSDEEIIPMCIADMDFQVSEAITEAMKDKAKHGIYGYTTFSERYFHNIQMWWEKRHGLKVDKEWISFSPGIIPGMNILLGILTEPGDGVIVQDPVYYPFYSTIENHGCTVMKNTLTYEEGIYSMNFEDLESKAKDPKTKVLILCSPHNPVGRVWTRQELERVAEICLEHDVWVISDEMHGDLVFEGTVHHPIFSIDEKLQQRSILCAAPSKTFNIAGLQTSILMIPNKELRETYEAKLLSFGLSRPNAFGVEGTIAAYEQGEPWLNDLLMYLEENLRFAVNYLKENIPSVKPVVPEATHLIWLDCSDLGMEHEELFEFFLMEAKIKFDEGYKFGPSGSKFVRMNIACPRERLNLALRRMDEAVLRKRVEDRASSV
ncbi:pyridoxal phosphate-dependent aminotransferase [Rossellomorea vietnamensis]|uniref:cysteine-S-conjugate beta-lyase n=1 Tax=Rossellomorea vietnamensis TaxID=218284 RepID=A0A5D4NUR7_9BACI|nr:MalY/PatB family protein [Rossellomorea vietnamensis]TYS17977.1 pyridoxal phosphate-dependent aminotransferase [Rossellomorea vietnamensis]